MIKIAVDISNATEAEILELNKIIPFGEKQFHFDRNNIEVNFITKKDAEIIIDNMGTKVFLKCNNDFIFDSHKGCPEINQKIVELSRNLYCEGNK